jgi:hypothetical protein
MDECLLSISDPRICPVHARPEKVAMLEEPDDVLLDGHTPTGSTIGQPLGTRDIELAELHPCVIGPDDTELHTVGQDFIGTIETGCAAHHGHPVIPEEWCAVTLAEERVDVLYVPWERGLGVRRRC